MAVFTCAVVFATVMMLVAGEPTNKTESAFTAKFTSNLDSVSSGNQRIVFDSVLTNIGDDYNPGDGKFTASIPGTYVFSVTLMSQFSADSAAFGCLQKNDADQFCVWSNGNNAHEMSSNTITLKLVKGDVVDVVLKTGNNYGLAGYCSFTGFLLYPQESLLEKLQEAISSLN